MTRRRITICVDCWHGRRVAARLVDGVLDDLFVDPTDATERLGTVFRARLARPLKGQGAWIVDLPGGRAGHLRLKGTGRPGDDLAVQVTGYAEAGKAVPVTSRLLLKSRYAIATPDAPGINVARSIADDGRAGALKALAEAEVAKAPPGGAPPGLILRSAAADAAEADVARDVARVLQDAASVAQAQGSGPAALLLGADPGMLAWREWSDAPQGDHDGQPGSFARHGVEDALDACAAPRVGLAAGASMFVEPTRALVAVDVNTGSDTTPAAALKANLAAARSLPRALRLRGLGGQIVVDFAPMSKRDRARLDQAVTAALRADPVETSVAGWTPLGHLELTRKRERQPLPGYAL